MDVHCTSCGEPWDTYHLRHDAIYDCNLSDAELESWKRAENKLTAYDRAKFKDAGWEFGGTLMNVRHCPCCPKDAKPDPEKAAMKAGIEEALGNDIDGIASTMEDFGL